MKRILNANFLESLNLIDDKMIIYMDNDTKSRNIYNGRNKIGFMIISVLALGFNLLLPIVISYGIQDNSDGSPLSTPSLNFLPLKVSIFLLLIWSIIWLLSNKKKNKSTVIYIRMFNINNYLIYLILELNLFFLTIFFKSLTITGAVLFFSLVFLISYFIVQSKKRGLEKLLFDRKIENKKIDIFIQKTIKSFIKYGAIVMLVIMLWKLIFPNNSDVRTDLIGFVSIIIMWLVADIGFIIAEAYLFIPYLLYGYYKAKYPEEYREWEGETQIEWYGEKYFNKYIKGTEREEK